METLKTGDYFGSTIKRRKFNGIVLTEKVHSIGEIIPVHAHENTYICTILEGNWEKKINRKSISCSPLKSIYHQPNEEHADIFIQGSRVFDIEIENSWLEYLKNFYKPSGTRTEYFNNEINWLAAKIFYEFTNSQNNTELFFEEHITNLLAKISHKVTPCKNERVPPAWLMNIKEFIEENFQKSISFKSLSEEYDIHPVHLSRTFKSFFNYNLGEYQQALRIKAACERIINSKQPIIEIAIQSGFYDQSHFYRVFKNQTGLLPICFRNIYKR